MLSFVPRNDNGRLQNHSTVLSDKSGMKKLKNLLANRSNYVDNSLITALQICSDKPPVTFIEHCTSLNNSYKKRNYTTVAIVIRGVLDYIPTILLWRTAIPGRPLLGVVLPVKSGNYPKSFLALSLKNICYTVC